MCYNPHAFEYPFVQHARRTPIKRCPFFMSKWVEIKAGSYRLVGDDDPRPEVHLPDQEGVPYFAYTPSWAQYEPLMHSGNPQTEIAATEAFIKERDSETRSSAKAREWEAGRKKSWQAEKPNWVKKGRSLVKNEKP